MGNSLALVALAGLAASLILWSTQNILDILSPLPSTVFPLLLAALALTSLNAALGGLVRGLGNFRLHMIGASLQQMFYIGMLVILVVSRPLPLGPMVAWTISLVAPAIIWFAFTANQAGALPSMSGETLRKQLKLGAPAHGYNVALLLVLRVDILLMSAVFAPAMIGLYALGRAAGEMLLYLPNLLGPVLMHGSREGVTALRNTVRTASTIMAIGSLIVLSLSPMAPIVFGGDYAPSVPLIAIHSILAYFLGIAILSAYLLFALDAGAKAATWSGVNAVGTGLLAWFVLQSGGSAAAVASAAAASSLIIGFVMLRQVGRIAHLGSLAELLVPRRADFRAIWNVVRG